MSNLIPEPLKEISINDILLDSENKVRIQKLPVSNKF
jgi:hypothetical protein